MSDAFVVVDQSLTAPPFAQIAEQMRSLIEVGSLQPGAELPTVRQLAGDLDVAPNTVARAYAELQAGGWIVSSGRRGTHVAGKPPTIGARARARLLREATSTFIASLTHRGYSLAEIAAELWRTLPKRGSIRP